jgi:tetratricopeptide (TPR) repeat protein
MESRSALRKRIERLVDFRPPRKAGLTFLSVCGICVFSAVAVPMGQGPAVAQSSSVSNGARTNQEVSIPSNSPAPAIEASPDADTLLEEGARLYRMGEVDEAEAKFNAALALEPNNPEAINYLMIPGNSRFMSANLPIRYFGSPISTNADGGLLFLGTSTNQTELYARAFRLNANAFFDRLDDALADNLVAGSQLSRNMKPGTPSAPFVSSLVEAARDYFISLGVDMQNPPGKAELIASLNLSVGTPKQYRKKGLIRDARILTWCSDIFGHDSPR